MLMSLAKHHDIWNPGDDSTVKHPREPVGLRIQSAVLVYGIDLPKREKVCITERKEGGSVTVSLQRIASLPA
jgi:hypothetical protein